MKDNYRTIEARLASLMPFQGNSLQGFMDESGKNYLVVSYRTLIATAQRDGGNWVSKTKYSVTTSRHQNLVRKAWGLN